MTVGFCKGVCLSSVEYRRESCVQVIFFTKMKKMLDTGENI